jgi:prolyl-tRNA synthetase
MPKNRNMYGDSWGFDSFDGSIGYDIPMIKVCAPPSLAPIQVVIVPIYKTDEQLESISTGK